MTIKKILLLLLFSFTLQTCYAGYEYNENYTNLYLELNSWCTNMDITFKVYNETDYMNKYEIEENLCVPGCAESCVGIENCTKCKKDCTAWNYINSPAVKLYNGPLTSIKKPLLFNSTANTTGEFELKINEPGQYLIEIFPNGDYNDYHQLLQIYTCEFAEESIKKLNEQKHPSTPKDQKFEYKNTNITLNVKQTILNNSETFQINNSITLGNKLNNTVKLFEITTKSANYTSIILTMPLNTNNTNTTTKVNKYDTQTQEWSEITYDNQLDEISFDVTSLGIYSVIQEPKPIPKEIITEKINESENITTPEPTTKQLNPKLIAQITAGVACFFLILFFIMKKNHSGNTHYYNTPGNIPSPPQKTEEKTILTTYEATYQKAQQYIQQYKENYSKDQLYRALEQSNVPRDIIDKVINEEYE